ncbi:hypothetical protein L6452_14115 [Arctium lappa]|uniref:Uncharacterized protein n=1 Tax=Arctium lappa TaxID=4217 RepID=A0ACB9CK61_ARCLA|nr:hypothetical protein L6452_14115 [Arctium lappa]
MFTRALRSKSPTLSILPMRYTLCTITIPQSLFTRRRMGLFNGLFSPKPSSNTRVMLLGWGGNNGSTLLRLFIFLSTCCVYSSPNVIFPLF